MEFTYNGLVRWGFGFYNPNHAAAAICAVLPFLWGWRRCPWIGWGLSVVLLVPLSLTYSRTGFAVAALEAMAWMVLSGRRKVAFGFIAAIAAVSAVGGVAMRFAPDAAALNRLSIWWAGLKLSALNPFGVGFGNSGLLASSFMLDGIECRTLVNSHLTLLAELGWFAGCAWIAFLMSGILGGVGRLRTWCAFVGLSVSASASSVFDWHVLFGIADAHSQSNLLLSWGLLCLYVICGVRLFLASWPLRRMYLSVISAVSVMILLLSVPKENVPVVRGGFVLKEGNPMPYVFHDGTWPFRSMLPYLEGGYRMSVEPGCVDIPGDAGSVVLFGAAAESAFRFPNAKIAVVSPPEFCTLPHL